MRTYVFTFFLLLISLSVSAQWVRVENAVPSVLQDFYFFDQNNGFVVGTDSLRNRGGGIFKTTDAGESWINVFSTPYHRHEIAALDFMDELHGIAVGQSQVFYKTDDGGQTWDSLVHPGESVLFESVQMTGNDIGYTANWRGEILKTTDGGNSWDINFLNSSSWESMFSLFCFDDQTCFAGSHSHLFKTEDGGAHWNFISDFTLLRAHWWDEMNGIGVRGTYYSGEPGFIYKTSDGGVTWRPIKMGEDIRINSMAFIGGVGFVGGHEEILMKTTNFGETWVKVHEHIGSEPYNKVNGIFMIDETHAFASTRDGTILKLAVEDEMGTDESFVQVFPNPFVDQINFALPYYIEVGEFELYDVAGRKVDQQKPPAGSFFYYENSELAPGIYYYRLDLKKEIGFEKETFTGKVIKM